MSLRKTPFLYAMTESDISPFSTFSNLSSGNYDITVTDAGGCMVTVPLTLGEEGANPSAAFSLNFEDLAATFTNTTQNASAYSWNFGDGNQSNVENATHTYDSEGTYSICLTATNDCGSDTYCQDYTIEAININKNFEFDFGEVRGNIGEIIKVPVYVKNFREIVGFQKSVHIEDPSIAKMGAITDVNLKDLSTGLFNIKDDHFSVSWYDGNIDGFDLPDSTIIYQFEVELLADDACTNIIIKDDPLPIQVYKKVGNAEVEIEAFKRTGQVCIGEGGINNTTANISGEILSEEGLMVSGVTINCTNATDQNNKENGSFLFEDLATPFEYQIIPAKTINPLNGITTFDLVIIQNHILGNELLNSPYKIIAADVNKTGTVTVSDILELRKLLLQDITQFSKSDSWEFIPMDYEFTNPGNPTKESYPTSAKVNLTNKNVAINFIGVKIGDVNGTASPNSLIQSESRRVKNGNFVISTAEQYLQAGEKVRVTFKGENIASILGFQYTLAFNPALIEVEFVKTNDVLTANNMGKSLINKGYLLTSWHNNAAESKQNNQLLTLKIKVKKAGYLSDLVKITDNFLSAEAYHKDGNLLNIQLDFTKPKLTLNPQFELRQNQPNPFAMSSVIKYQLPDNGKVALSIFDIQGRLIKSIKENGQKGWNELEIEGTALSQSGIYYYRLNTPFGQAMKKMILIE